MTNADGPRGVRVVGRMGGGEPTMKEYDIDTGTATAIFIGDVAKLDTDGNASVMAAASDDYIGPIVGLRDSDGKPVGTLAASTAGKMTVCIDPMAILEVQTEDGGTALTAAAIGDCADFIWTHAGSGSRAGVELSETLVGNANSAQMRILEKVDMPNNDWSEHYVRLLVIAAEHAFLDTPNAI